jgi:hypothetical protein
LSPIEIAWTVVGIIVPVSVGLGYGAMGLAPPDFKFARGCFWFSSLLLAGVDIVWTVQTQHSFIWRAIVSGLIGATIFILLPEGLRLINRRQTLSASPPYNPPPAAPRSEPEPPLEAAKPVPTPPDKPPQTKSAESKPETKPEQPRTIIQTAPAYGNLKTRTLKFCSDQQRELALIQQASIRSDNPNAMVEFKSFQFRGGVLPEIRKLRDEFAGHGYHDIDLDDFFATEDQYEQDENKMRQLRGPSIPRPTLLLAQMERVVDELKGLADQLPN